MLAFSIIFQVFAYFPLKLGLDNSIVRTQSGGKRVGCRLERTGNSDVQEQGVRRVVIHFLLCILELMETQGSCFLVFFLCVCVCLCFCVLALHSQGQSQVPPSPC